MKIDKEKSNVLKIYFWDNKPVYWMFFVICVMFFTPPLIVHIQINVIVSIYYTVLIFSFWYIIIRWSSSNLLLEIDKINDCISWFTGSRRTGIYVAPLSKITDIKLFPKELTNSRQKLLTEVDVNEETEIIIQFEIDNHNLVEFDPQHSYTLGDWALLKTEIEKFLFNR